VSLIKTTKDTGRSFTELKRFPVQENLPLYFELQYPKLNRFLELYYQESSDESAERYLENLQYKRDFVAAGEDLLRFMSKELLLGQDYFDLFVDKQAAIQTSNLLYRSKGTEYSIQQFFRVFFGYNVDVSYGRDEVFMVGDPFTETLEYQGKYVGAHLYPGSRIRFTFEDGEIDVYAQKSNGDYVFLRQDIDYEIEYSNRSIVFLKNDDPIEDDINLQQLAELGLVPSGVKVKVVIKRNRPVGSMIGDDVTEKKITNNGYYQLFSLLIRAPVSISTWKEAYKDFIHPAGMYLEGQVLIQSVAKLFKKTQPDATTDQYRKLVEASAALLEFVHSQITELTLRSYPAPRESIYSSQYSELDSDEMMYSQEQDDSADKADEVYRLRINDLDNNVLSMEEFDRQFIDIRDLDDIKPKRLDDNLSDMSQTFNTMDENFWNKDKQDALFGPLCPDQHILGNSIDFPPEYPGCPGFIFAMGPQHLQGQYLTPKLMNVIPGDSLTADQIKTDAGPIGGLGRVKYTAYRTVDMNMYSIDYTTETSSNTQSSLWLNNIDYSNPYSRAKVVASGMVIRNYFVPTYIDNFYSAQDSDGTSV
jgi:hypothetical protein